MKSEQVLDIVIFSFNRAMQLNTLIASVYEYFQYPFKITVLYNCTTQHCKGYEILKNRYPQVNFAREEKESRGYSIKELSKLFNLKRYLKYKYIRAPKSDFRRKLISILSNSESQFVMFLTDDSVFIRPVRPNQLLLNRIADQPTDMQYSLRLGEDINSPKNYGKESEFMVWDYYDEANDRDWRYNFSVDAHIYDRKYILSLAQDIIFNNPNSYESFTKIRICQKWQQRCGVANLAPCILSFPINMVQTVQDNESLSVSTEQLEKYFIEGYSLRYRIPEKIDTFQYYPETLFLEKDGVTKELSTATKS